MAWTEEQRAKQREYNRRSYAKHREQRKREVDQRVRDMQERVTEVKRGTPCADCQQVFHPVCMDFDHVRGTKVLNVSAAVLKGWGWDRLEAEIAKCDLVCSNCHRLRTHLRRGGT